MTEQREHYLGITVSKFPNMFLMMGPNTGLGHNSMVFMIEAQARFQIEFLFRDAKQFTGLCDCQARSEKALHHHFNASFSALNLLKWQDRQYAPQRTPISIASWKRRCFNVLFMERIFSNSAFDLTSIKSSTEYQKLCNFGVIL